MSFKTFITDVFKALKQDLQPGYFLREGAVKDKNLYLIFRNKKRRLKMKFFIFAVFSFNLFAYGQTVIPVCKRTPQVRDAIVEKLKENVDSNINCNLADHFLDQIQFLYIRGKGIETLWVGDFSGLISLKELSLNGNKISGLPVGVFAGLTSLEELYLWGNNLGALSVGVFSGLASLKELGLGGNNLSDLPVGIFAGLTSLRWLGLSDNNRLNPGVEVFSGLPSLQVLGLGGNSLTEDELKLILKGLPSGARINWG